MPPRERTKDDKHWCGGWPVTLRRIRTFMEKWKGQPVDQVPFSMHAIKMLMDVIEGDYTPPTDPYDAPWMGNVDPHDFEDWKPGYAPTDPPVKYTEVDRVLHNTIEVCGPSEQPVPGGYGEPEAPKKTEEPPPKKGLMDEMW